MDDHSSQSDELKREIVNLRAKLNLVLAMSSHAEAECKRLQSELTELRSSVSWRMSMPIRIIDSWIKKLLS
ncbi:hypothetical protein [Streptomyces sp. AcH 505]|uniref:hypothetical protein n=1 Tax=Streptomyces sp. AcH 505 TaxID=352211 RepID=UPI0018E3D6E2